MSNTSFSDISTNAEAVGPEGRRVGSPSTQRTVSQPDHQASGSLVEEPDPVSLPRRPAINEHNAFHLLVGTSRHRFTIDVTDLRRESALFRQCTSITSIELRHEDPRAVQLIENWFSGNLGHPPLSPNERNVFRNAARISKNLQIKELEAQLLVVVDRVEKSFADLLYTQLHSGTPISAETINEYVLLEAEPFMVRSPNVGGRDDDEDDYDPAIHGLM